MAQLYKLWQQIGTCQGNINYCNTSNQIIYNNYEEVFNNNMRNKDVDTNDNSVGTVVYTDCHSSNKGLFLGFVVLVGCFLSIILFFISMSAKRYVLIILLQSYSFLLNNT